MERLPTEIKRRIVVLCRRIDRCTLARLNSSWQSIAEHVIWRILNIGLVPEDRYPGYDGSLRVTESDALQCLQRVRERRNAVRSLSLHSGKNTSPYRVSTLIQILAPHLKFLEFVDEHSRYHLTHPSDFVQVIPRDLQFQHLTKLVLHLECTWFKDIVGIASGCQNTLETLHLRFQRGTEPEPVNYAEGLAWLPRLTTLKYEVFDFTASFLVVLLVKSPRLKDMDLELIDDFDSNSKTLDKLVYGIRQAKCLDSLHLRADEDYGGLAVANILRKKCLKHVKYLEIGVVGNPCSLRDNLWQYLRSWSNVDARHLQSDIDVHFQYTLDTIDFGECPRLKTVHWAIWWVDFYEVHSHRAPSPENFEYGMVVLDVAFLKERMDMIQHSSLIRITLSNQHAIFINHSPRDGSPGIRVTHSTPFKRRREDVDAILIRSMTRPKGITSPGHVLLDIKYTYPSFEPVLLDKTPMEGVLHREWRHYVLLDGEEIPIELVGRAYRVAGGKIAKEGLDWAKPGRDLQLPEKAWKVLLRRAN